MKSDESWPNMELRDYAKCEHFSGLVMKPRQQKEGIEHNMVIRTDWMQQRTNTN